MTSRAGVFNYYVLPHHHSLAYRKSTRSRNVLADEGHQRPLLVRRKSAANHAVAGLSRTRRKRGATSPPDDGSGKGLDKRRVATTRILKAWRVRVPRTRLPRACGRNIEISLPLPSARGTT